MKLNIVNAGSHQIDKKLGISAARTVELFDFVEQQFIQLKAQGINIRLVDYYSAVADFCNNIEEYTLCMHCFIFNLASAGTPLDSQQVGN